MKMFSAHKRFSETREDLGVHEEAAPSIPSEVSTRNGNKAGRDKEKLLKFEQTNRFSGERDAARIKTKGRTSPSGFLSDLDAALSPPLPSPALRSSEKAHSHDFSCQLDDRPWTVSNPVHGERYRAGYDNFSGNERPT